MRCLSPRTVGFMPDGKTIAWSPKNYSKQYATFQLPCGKCIECRLEYARSVAVRCVHEAKMHRDNSFVTLTYSEENLRSDKLIYSDFQEFVKRLRSSRFDTMLKTNGLSRKDYVQLPKEERDKLYDPLRIGVLVTGEYGDRLKRPHWHCLLFNYRPTDCVYKYSNDRGDRVFSSEYLTNVWKNGIVELGDVTFESAGYCARYAAKKLVHGKDGEHEYNPIHKRSSKNAIGKSFVERYWQDMFSYGYVVLDGGIKTGIPRYYEKWLSKNRPDDYLRYLTEVKLPRMEKAETGRQRREREVNKINNNRDIWNKGLQVSDSKVRETIINERFKRLQSHLKGDI